MKFVCGLFLTAALATAGAAEVSDLQPTLKIGDPAPALEVKTWLRGTPVTRFEPGQVYVLDFWATWCGPCIAVMPHLSELQKKHEGRLTVIGVNAREASRSAATVDLVRKSVEKHSAKIDYAIAMDDPEKQAAFDAWQVGSGCLPLPTAFVVDKTGRVVWIGHPNGEGQASFDAAVEQALAGKSDLVVARTHAEKVYLNDAINSRFYRLFEKLVREDEGAALVFAQKVSQDVQARNAIGSSYGGTEAEAYWGTVASQIGTEDGLSPPTYLKAIADLRKLVAWKPAHIGGWFSLASLQARMGNFRQAAVAQEGGIKAARALKGMESESIKYFEDVLARYKSRI